MSIEYCHYCDVNIDTDYNVEHFILNEANDEIVSCIVKEMDQED